MTPLNTINILVAEDNDVSRQMMSAVLSNDGYDIIEARDGTEAIELIRNISIDLALVDINMNPIGGFEFVRYLRTNNIKTDVVIITGDDSSDILIEAQTLGVLRVLQKPVEPDRLQQTVTRALEKQSKRVRSFGSETHKSTFSPEELIKKAIDLAENNARSGKGRPYGAVITDKNGHILGEGVNGSGSRIDPTAHAEIIAIRKAAEKLGKTDLSECVLYCSSEPTMMGRALIVSAGIERVFFGLSHKNIKLINGTESQPRSSNTVYKQLCKAEAEHMFRKWQQD